MTKRCPVCNPVELRLGHVGLKHSLSGEKVEAGLVGLEVFQWEHLHQMWLSLLVLRNALDDERDAPRPQCLMHSLEDRRSQSWSQIVFFTRCIFGGRKSPQIPLNHPTPHQKRQPLLDEFEGI